MEENKEMMVREGNYTIKGFEGLNQHSQTRTEVYTNIDDDKMIFNLENNVDNLLNNCEGELIRVRKVLVKRYIKPLEVPIVDVNGEIIKDTDITMSCVLVDEQNKSYATGSKVFTIQLMRYMQQLSARGVTDVDFTIKIIKKKYGEKGNKALSFELV